MLPLRLPTVRSRKTEDGRIFRAAGLLFASVATCPAQYLVISGKVERGLLNQRFEKTVNDLQRGRVGERGCYNGR